MCDRCGKDIGDFIQSGERVYCVPCYEKRFEPR